MSAASSNAESTPLRILVVEDHEDSRLMMVEVLAMTGEHEIALAQNAAEGLRHLRDRTYDLIVTDIGLPDLSGLEMLDQAHREGLLVDATIVVCSATALPAPSAFSSVACIPKPVDLDRLVAVVRATRRRGETPSAREKRRADSKGKVRRALPDSSDGSR